MKFIIKRTSDWGDEDIQPHERSYEGTFKGYEGRAEKCWFIDIENLEELIKFKESVDSDIVISHEVWCKDYQVIEIYDDWRE